MLNDGRMRRIAGACLIGMLWAVTPAAGQEGADRMYRAAAGLLNRGVNDLAAAEFTKFLSEHPNHAKGTEARYGLAVCRFRMGQHAEAAVLLDKVVGVEDFEFAPDALTLRGQCATAAGEHAEASKWFERVLREHDGYVQVESVAAMLAESLYFAKDTSRAREVAGMVVERWPRGAAISRAEYVLALCDVRDDRFEAAAERLKSLRDREPSGQLASRAALIEAQCREKLGDHGRSRALFEVAAKSADPAVAPEAALGAARGVRRAGQPAQARRAIEVLLKEYPEAVCAPEARFELARSLFDESKFDESLRVLDELSTGAGKGAELPEVKFWQAKCMVSLGKGDQAVRLLDVAAAAARDDGLRGEILYEKGLLLEQAGDLTGAADCMALAEQAGGKADVGAAPSAARCAILHREGRYAESLAACEGFMKKYASQPHAADVRYLIAENEFLQGRFGRAEAAYGVVIEAQADDPRIARAMLRRGLSLVELDRVDEAEPLLERAAGDESGTDPAVARVAMSALGDLAFEKEDWAAAERWYLRWLASTDGAEVSGAGVEVVHLKLGLCAKRLGHAAEAAERFAVVEKRFAGRPVALRAKFERGLALSERGDHAGARAALEEVIESEAKGERAFSAHALRQLAAMDSKDGNAVAAAARLEQLSKFGGDTDAGFEATLDRGILLLGAASYEAALGVLSDFIRSHPDHARIEEARGYHAIALARTGKVDEAIAAMDKAESAGSAVSQELRAAIMYERACLQLGAKQEAAAEATLSRILEQQNVPPAIESNAAITLAQMRLDDGKPGTAIALLDKADVAATRTQGNDARSISERGAYVRGACELKLGRAEAAAATLAKVADGGSASIHCRAGILLGDALVACGKPAEAVARLREVAERAEDKAIRQDAVLRIGEASAAAQDWEASVQAMGRFLSECDDCPLWYRATFGLGWAQENAGKHEAAIEAFGLVVARHKGPTAARAQFQIGECLFALKRYDEAASELLKVDILYDYPEWSAAALYEAGRCLRESGKEPQAREQFQQASARFPGTNWARLADEALAAKVSAVKENSIPGIRKESQRKER